MKIDGPMDWYGIVVGSLMLAVSPFLLHRYWRGRSISSEYLIAGYWYKSEGLRRGHVRATVPTVLGGAGVFLVVFLLMLDPPGQIFDWVFLIFLAVELVLAALYWSIVLFNWPRILVAPHHRDEIGAIEARRRRRSALAPKR